MSILLHIGVKSQSLLQRQMTAANDPDPVDSSMAPEESKMYRPPPQTYPSCFGLPYQDHNYGAPPPPTPPASPPPPARVVNGHIDIDDIVVSATEVVTTEDSDLVTADDSVTRCICDFQHDDGYMICCDKCSVWQHVDCMGVDRNNIPDKYLCELCEPRKVDKQRAVQIQTRKRMEIAALDSSSTETEDETKTAGAGGKKGKAKKKEKKEKPNNKMNKKNKKGKKEKEKEKKKRDKPGNSPNNKKKTQNLNNSIATIAAVAEAGAKSSPASVTSSTATKKKTPNRTPKSPKSPVVSPSGTRTQSVTTTPESDRKREADRKLMSTPVSVSVPENEDAQDSWNRNPTSDTYEEAKTNQYSVDIQNIFATKKLNGQHGEGGDSKPLEQLQVQLCRIRANRKGLEASQDLTTNQPVLEYKGKVMLRQQYDKENMFFKRVYPFVLFYSKFENMDLCVDASSYGNTARFVRRSCVPNAEIRHVVESGNVHFYIYSTKSISKGAEVTIPFDFDYQECNYGVECACPKSNCAITKFHKKESRTTPAKISLAKNSDDSGGRKVPCTRAGKKKRSSKSLDLRSSVTEPPNRPDSTVVPPSGKRRKVSPLKVSLASNKQEQAQPAQVVKSTEESSASLSTSLPATPAPVPLTPLSPSHHLDFSHDGEDHEHGKKMTREERKMEAIMKAFEKLEKREERRKEALARLEQTKKGRGPETPVKDAPETIPEESPEEKKPEVKTESQKPKTRKKKGKHPAPARRRSRMNSGASGTNSGLDASSADESSNLTTPSTPLPSLSGENSTATTPSAANYNKAFRFPKKKKVPTATLR